MDTSPRPEGAFNLPESVSSATATDPILPAFDVALNALLKARDIAAVGMTGLSAVFEALRAECDTLRAESVKLQLLLGEQCVARHIEQDAIRAERGAFEDKKGRLRAEKIALMEERDSLAKLLNDARQKISQMEERANRNSATVQVKSESTHRGIGTASVKNETTVKSEPSHPGRSIGDSVPSRKRVNRHEDVTVKLEEPPAKIRKVSPTKSDARRAPGTKKVEVVITRLPRAPPSRISVHSNVSVVGGSTVRLAVPVQNEGQPQIEDRKPSPARPLVVPRRMCLNFDPARHHPTISKIVIDPDLPRRSIPQFKAEYRHIFDLATLPARPVKTLVNQHVHLFDFGTFGPRRQPSGPNLVTHHQPLFDFATLPRRIRPRQPSQCGCASSGIWWLSFPFTDDNFLLLDAPIFKQCLWSTEFFTNSNTLDALLTDPSLTEYFPFITRLHQLNQAGIPQVPAQVPGMRREKEVRHTLFFEENPDLRTVSVNGQRFLYSWGCVVRFLLLDMLLRCKGYKPSAAVAAVDSVIHPSARGFTKKLYKWQKYLTDAIANSRGREQHGVPPCTDFQAAGTDSNSAQAYKNLLTATVCIMLILEEPYLPSEENPSPSFELLSLPNFDKFPLSAREQLPFVLSTATVYRHLAVFLFVSPLCALVDHDLEAANTTTQILFNTSKALGSAHSTLIDSGEMYVRNTVRTLIADPTLGVAGAFLRTTGVPRYMPPPYNETFFNAGQPARIRYD
ncbi:hypothetical protein DFH09DRAFT_1211456 [Mycena vulgaris]|nr:hypothetical protein DFH09DRAFT_1211456 [Mycena vulgaris]